MGVYLFSLHVLDQLLWEDRERTGSSHDFGKDILPRMVKNNARVFAFPFSGYWVDVGTVDLLLAGSHGFIEDTSADRLE